MLNARKGLSGVKHLIPDSTSQFTFCGIAGPFVGKWADSDPNTDRRNWKECAKCRKSANRF